MRPSESDSIGPLSFVGQAQQGEHAIREPELLVRHPALQQQVTPEGHATRSGPLGNEQVLAYRHAREQLGALERARQAQARPTKRRHAGDVAAVEQHPAVVGAQEAVEAVEEGGLAGAVRADETDELTGADLDRHIAQRGDAGRIVC